MTDIEKLIETAARELCRLRGIDDPDLWEGPFLEPKWQIMAREEKLRTLFVALIAAGVIPGKLK